MKYIQAIKILNRWKAFKNNKIKMEENKERQELMDKQFSPAQTVNEENESIRKTGRTSQVLNDRLENNDVRTQRVQNIGKQINERRDESARQHRLDDEADNDRTRKMPYAIDEPGLQIEHNSLEDSYPDLGGERGPMSSRNPEYRNKYMKNTRENNSMGDDKSRARGKRF